MRAAGLLTELALSPLEAADTAPSRRGDLRAARSPTPDARLLHATTGGFPLYVVEAARATADLGPRAAAGRRPHRGAAQPPRPGDAGGPGGRRPGGRGRPELHPRPAHRGERPGRRRRWCEAVDELWRRRIIREFRDGYDFSHDLLRDTAYAQVSPPKRWLLHRRIAQGLELLHADDTDARLGPARRAVRPRRAAGAGGGLLPAGGRRRGGQVRPRRGDPAAPARRWRSCATLPAGRDRDGSELGVLEAMAAPLNARYGYSSPELQQTLERSVALAERSAARTRCSTGLVGLWASQFVQGRHRRRRTGRPPRAGPRRARLRAERRRRTSPSAGRPSAWACRPRRCATSSSPPSWRAVPLAERRHPARRARHGLGGARPLAARPRRRGPAELPEAIALARAIDHPYSLAVALAYGAITHQMRATCPS